MTRNNEFMNRGGQNYDAPSATVVDIHSEGLLCVSASDSVIDDATEDNWGTLN